MSKTSDQYIYGQNLLEGHGTIPSRIPEMKGIVFTMTIWVEGQPQIHGVKPSKVVETDWGKRYEFNLEFNLADYDKLRAWHQKQNEEVAEMVKEAREKERIKHYFEGTEEGD